MTEEEITLLATIYGEAAQSSPAAWRAIASVIMNRVGQREWRKLKTPLAVIAKSRFDAFAERNQPYRVAAEYFADPQPGGYGRLKALAEAVLPIYYGTDPRTTDAQLYYSPKAQAALHKAKPRQYRVAPPWDWMLLEAVDVPGTEGDDFIFFRYRTAQPLEKP